MDETETERSEAVSDLPERVPGKHLNQQQMGLILTLRDGGLLEAEIANRPELRCSISTVSRVLSQFSDTRPLARRYLEGSALPLARSVTSAALEDGALGAKVLTGLGVLGASVGHGVAVQVNVGCGDVDVEATLPVLPGTLGAP